MREFVGCPDFACEGVNFTPRLAFTIAKLGEIAFHGLDTKTRNEFIDTFGTN